MSILENDIQFSSNRILVEQAAMSAPAEPAADTHSRAIVLSQTKGLAEMVARGVAADGITKVSALTMSLSQFVDLPDLSLSEVAICLFEIVQGDDTQLSAIRKLHLLGEGKLKIVGVTSEVLTLATARLLIDAGVADVLPLDAVKPDLNQATPLASSVDAVIAERGVQMHNGMIVAVAQTRGGIGATTFALNLATMLATKPKRSRKTTEVDAPRVAIVDLDLQNGVLGASIDVVENTAFVEMLREGTLPDAALVKAALVPHKTGFDVLPAPSEFVPIDSMRPEMMACLLDELRMAYDYIILDMPRTMAEWIDPILARVDKMYLLSDTAVHSVRQARRMMDFYCEEHVALPLDVVVSLERKPFATGSAIKETEKFLARKLTHWVPRDDKSAKLAMDRGQTLLATKPKSTVKKAMDPMAAELTKYFAADQRRRA